MAHVYRLIAAAFLAVFSFSVHALVPTQSGWQTGHTSYGGLFSATTKDAACAAWSGPFDAKLRTLGYAYGGYTVKVDENTCRGWSKTSTGANDQVITQPGFTSVAGLCPANSTAVSGGCQCASGYVENGAHTACQLAPNECQQQAGQPDAMWRYDGGYGATPNPLASELCKAGTGVRCIVKVADPKCTQGRFAGTGNPYWTCRGQAYYTGGWGTGAACDRSTAANGDGGTGTVLPPVTAVPPPDDLPPNTAAPTDCPPGTFEGTVNGTHTCVEDIGRPASTNSPDSGQTVQKNPDGSTTTTNTTGTTVCANGSCTTTNNVSTNITGNPNSTCPAGTAPSGPNGSASSCTGTSTNSGTEAQTEFCKDHPKDKQCGGDGGFGGSCVAGFKATGEDPVLNAMALEQYKRNCEIFDTTGAVSQAFAVEAAKTGDQTTELPGNSTQDLSGGADMTDALGGGSCPADQTIPINVAGRSFSFVLAVSKACQGLEWLGVALVAATAIACAFIVFKD